MDKVENSPGHAEKPRNVAILGGFHPASHIKMYGLKIDPELEHGGFRAELGATARKIPNGPVGRSAQP